MKNYVRLQGLGALSDKVTLDIEGFTDKRVVQCYVQAVGNTFTDDSK